MCLPTRSANAFAYLRASTAICPGIVCLWYRFNFFDVYMSIQDTEDGGREQAEIKLHSPECACLRSKMMLLWIRDDEI